MKINYGKLRRMCVERDIAVSALFKELGITGRTVVAFANDRSVSLQTIDRICTYFQCQPCDIMSFINDDENGEGAAGSGT